MGRRKNLVGEQFGMLLVKRQLSDNIWLCKCDCGNPKLIKMTTTQLKTRSNPNCGCRRRNNIAGKTFGKLRVVSYDEKGKWLCKCSCGYSEPMSVRETDLVNEVITSCGCDKDKDLTAAKFGRLRVIGIDKVVMGTRRWICQCNCGYDGTFSIEESQLKNGSRISCGRCKTVSLVHKTFGKLRVERAVDSNNNWWCKCSCGNENLIFVPAWALTTGVVNNCGCEARLDIYKQNNIYRHIDDTTVIFASNTGTEFYIDRYMYDKIKEYRWAERNNGLCAYTKIGLINIASILTEGNVTNAMILFKDGNNKNYRINNIIIGDGLTGNINKKVRTTNKTGHTGVSLYGKNKYRAQICVNGRNIVLGVRADINDAIKLRQEAEKKYLGVAE